MVPSVIADFSDMNCNYVATRILHDVVQAVDPVIRVPNILAQNWVTKPRDRSNFNTHNTCWKCCINNDRPTGQKQQIFDGKTVKNKGKLILMDKKYYIKYQAVCRPKLMFKN